MIILLLLQMSVMFATKINNSKCKQDEKTEIIILENVSGYWAKVLLERVFSCH